MAPRSVFAALILPLITVDVVRAQGLGGLWPVPQPTFTSGSTPLFISESIGVTYNGESLALSAASSKRAADSLSSTDIVQAGVSRTLDNIFSQNFVPWTLVPRNSISNYEPSCDGTGTIQTLDITLTATTACSSSSNSTSTGFTPSASDVDESYSLSINEQGAAKLSASTATGVLRGLETFSQLFYESTDGNFYMVNAPIDIQDSPTYPWRGVLLDTARNFLPMETIQRIIDGMAASKMNKLHMHVTDSQSWPLDVPSLPELSAKGAYNPSQVYSTEDIEALQVYGIYRGVDVYFEIDMPGHIGVVGEAFPDLVVAYDARPYTTYCAEPPCGALKLNNSDVETFLGTMFDDVLPRVGRYTSFWHTGGDELNANDYLLDPAVNTSDTAVLQPLLQAFIDTQHDRIRNAGLNPMVWEEIPTTWNVTLGADVVVQSWLGGTAVADLANAGHKVIDSNYNFWYLDCGRGAWLTYDNEGFSTGYPFTDWCGPTKSWGLVYSHDPAAGLNGSAAAKNVLGGEVALWSETIDAQNLDSLTWPRAAAAAETLWSGRIDAATGQNRSQVDAAPRLNAQRARLVARGIGAAPIQMEWCTMYPNATGCQQPDS